MLRKTNDSFNFNSFLIKQFSPGKQFLIDGKEGIVYHYTSPNAFMSIIKDKALRFTDIRYLNDKSEGVYFVKCLLEYLDKNRGKFPHFEEVVNDLLKENDMEKIKALETTDIKFSEIPQMPFKPQRVFVFCTCTASVFILIVLFYNNKIAWEINISQAILLFICVK